MIKKIEKFFCMTPLLLALLCTSFVSGGEIKPPDDILREQADDCIQKIRKKQKKIKKEIEEIKKLIKIPAPKEKP
tara:strand:- start:165 stop:389 length:225 start_codon:yes stop_codon:yes gene_type:complete